MTSYYGSIFSKIKIYRPIVAIKQQFSSTYYHSIISPIRSTLPIPRDGFHLFTTRSHEKIGDFGSTTNNKHKSTTKKFVPRKAAISLTPEAREFCKSLLQSVKDSSHTSEDEIIGIMLGYQQSSKGKLSMVFSFDFVRKKDITSDDESVSLEVMPDGSPKPPTLSYNDGLPKLYIHHNAFMKVLGGTLDVKFEQSGDDTTSFNPILYDRDGNEIDPNA